MHNTFLTTDASYRLRLPNDGPLLGYTRWSEDGKSVRVNLFATPDDSGSDPALALLASYIGESGSRLFAEAVRTKHPSDTEARAPYFVLTVDIAETDFSDGIIQLEVLTLHKIMKYGEPFHLPNDVDLKASLNTDIDYDAQRQILEFRLQENQAMLFDPKPVSHSFENRSNRSLDEALVTLRLPPKKEKPSDFKFIATNCRYPGFAFESQRVDAASYHVIAEKHKDASGMLMLGDQIYADATAGLFEETTSLEEFQELYHQMFRSPGVAKAVRTIPCYMTGDDHEFRDNWSVPDDSLSESLHSAAQRSFGIYQLSHSSFAGGLDAPPHDHAFNCGAVAVYLMDTISNRNTLVPGEERIVSAQQLDTFERWLESQADFEYVLLATGGVVAPGFKTALDADGVTDVSRAQGFENWQAANKQRVRLLDILATSQKKILLVSGDYHCAATASVATGGKEIAKAVVVPPAYAPMRYVNKTIRMLAPLEKTSTYEITLNESQEGSGFAVISIENGEWAVKFETVEVADT